jgi:capsular exopolysaccharide synthesis family protein
MKPMHDSKPDFSVVPDSEPGMSAPTRANPEMSAMSAAVPPPETAPRGGGLNFRPILRAARRHPIVIVGTAGIVSAIAVLTSGLSNPTYQGKFQLLIEPATSGGPSVDPAQILPANSSGIEPTVDYNTQVQILRSSKMLSDISRQVKERFPKFPSQELNENLTVARVGGEDFNARAKVIEVEFQGNDPNLVREVLELTAKRYLRYSLEDRSSRLTSAVRFIDDQIPGLRQRVSTLEQQLQRLQENYQVIDPQDQGAKLFLQVRDVSNQHQQLQGQLREQRRLFGNLQQQLKMSPDEALAASTLSQNPNYQSLLAQQAEVERQIAVAAADLQPENPQMQSLMEKRQNLSRLVAQESQRLLRQAGSRGGTQSTSFQNPLRVELIEKMIEAKNGVEMLQIRDQELARLRQKLETQARTFPGVARQYTDLRQQLDLANKTLTQLLTQREALRVQAAQREFPWELISPPALLLGADGQPLPTYGKVMRNILLGTAGGLFLGLALALMMERKRNVFSTVDDITETNELPLLGTLPFHAPIKQFGRLSDTILLLGEAEERRQEEQSQFVAACDYIFTNLCFQNTDPPIRSLAVCGMESGDGQSTLVLQLGRTAASMGQRVLVVDANWQNPQLHEYLKISNHIGLGDMLVNDTNKAVIQQAPGIENLFVLPFGEMPLNNGRLIASPRMMKLVEKLQSNFELVIFDTPQILEAMETNFLAAQTDGVLLVLSVGKTKRSVSSQVMQQLKTFKIPCLGVVANHQGGLEPAEEQAEEAPLQDAFAGLMHPETPDQRPDQRSQPVS